MVIDELAGSVELPATHGRKNRKRVRLADVESVFVESITKSAIDGEYSPTYAPALRIQGAPPGTERLAQWLDQDRAAQFVQWFQERLPQKSGSVRPLAGKF
jgi:hypothetical protein